MNLNEIIMRVFEDISNDEEANKIKKKAEPPKPTNKIPFKVDRFFAALESSSLMPRLNFDTNMEKAHAIVKFADLIGVPRAKITLMLHLLNRPQKDTNETE